MNCYQCPVGCGTDRSSKSGACGVSGLKIAKYGLFAYEEPPISFGAGSGCVFFCGCSLKCAFCQNYELSRNLRGKEIAVSELADIFKRLEDGGAENINLVNPTHYLRHIADAIEIYKPKIPVVYNTHGYETQEALSIADGIVDIYLTDLKFIDGALAKRYTVREDYAKYALPAVERMSKKPLVMCEDGKMLSGCIVRHLVLPQAVYDTLKVIEFVASLNGGVYFSLMSQYTPYGEAQKFAELSRKITKREYRAAVEAVERYGLKNVFVQEYSSATKEFIPDWDF